GCAGMIGRTLGRYRVEEKLGEGGMGVVYLAMDVGIGRRVALKVLHPDAVANPERRRRFPQDAGAADALNHPAIVVLHDVGQAEGIDFIVMEHVEGLSLQSAIRGARLDPRQSISYASQIADALAAAHAAGIVHRDLKPSNVIVT